MKKLRLISFMLAFVMVVAMMVPALSILIAADGDTLPGGDQLGAWNIGFNGASPLTGLTQAATATIDNPLKDAAWAGAAYQLGAAEVATADSPVGTGFSKAWTVTPKKALATDNLYGLMLDLTASNGNNNIGVTVLIDVDGVAYYNLAKITVEADTKYAGATNYFKPNDGEWTMASNINYDFSGDTRASGDAVNGGNFERTIRFPGGFSGKWFIPLESFTTVYGNENPASKYHSKPDVTADANVLTADTLANATAVTIYVGAVYSANMEVNGASVVYDTDWVAPIAAPSTLPALDAEEWDAHAGYNFGTYQADYPDGVFIKPSIAGADYELSDSLLAETLLSNVNSFDGDDYYSQAEVTAVPAEKNLVGLMFRIKAPNMGGNNIGTTLAFKSNGNFYTGRIGNGAANGGRASYIYDVNTTNDTWMWYRDPTSHTTARTIANFDGFIFIPIENFIGLKDQTKTFAHRQDGVAYGYDAYADVTTAGISLIEIGHSWAGQDLALELLEVNYVYSDGIKTSNAYLPHGDLLSWSMTYTAPSSAGEIYTIAPNATGDAYWANSVTDVVAVDGSKLEAPIATKGDEFLSSYEYDLTGLKTADLIGINIAIDTTAATNSNNGTVVAIDVDGKVYYNVSFTEKVNSYILRENTGDWIVVSGFGSEAMGAAAPGVYERAVRLPNAFVGEMFIPLESFRAAYGTSQYNDVKVEDAAAEEVLTAEILANATSVKLSANTTWNDTTVFGAANIVYRGPYVELAPEGDKPTVLPAESDVAFRTDYNNNFWTEDVVADNAVTPIDEMWGATFAASGVTVEDVTDAVWADFAGILLTVATTEKASVKIDLNFTSETAGNATFSTAKGFGAKPIYLWQGGDKWIVEGAGDTFTIPANYTGYVYIPVTALTGTSGNDFSGFYKGYNSWACALFSNVVAEIGATYTYAGLTVTGVEATAELLWVDALSDVIDATIEEKPTTFPNNNEALALVYGGIFNVGVEDATDAFLNSFTAFDVWGTAADPLSGTGNSNFEKTIGSDRIMPSKFNGATMLTESLVSVGGTVGSAAENKVLTMTVDGTPTINAATAAGLLLKASMAKANDIAGIGLDFSVTVGGNTYHFFNNAENTSYAGNNAWMYMYNNFSSYAENTWTVTQGDSKIRLPGPFDGYLFLPFAMFKNGDTALDMNLVASAGITEVSVYGYWNNNPLTVESVEVASVPATLANSSITVGNDITLNASAIVTGTPTSVKANFILGENTVTVDGVAGENSIYTFALPGIGAHQMMDAIDIELVVDDAVVSTVNDYTIAEYAAKVLRAAGDENKVKKMAVDLLYYGDAVQNLLGYNTDNLATSVLTTEELDNRSNNMINKVKDEVKVEGAISENVQWKNVAVLPVDGGISVVFSAVVVDATDVTITVKKGDATETFAADKWGVVDNQYIVVYNNIGITELDTELTASFVKGTAAEGATLTASVNAVLAAIADKNSGASAAEKELAICLYALSNSLANFAK